MQEDLDLELNIDTAVLNRILQYFCGSIFLYYQDVLTDREIFVCKLLIKGHSLQGVSKLLGLSAELVRTIYFKAIKKVRKAFQNSIDEMAKFKDENIKLQHRNLILENELLSEQSLASVKSILNQEESLCRNAQLLLTTSLSELPLPPRVKNVLNTINVTTFSEIPQLSQDLLLLVRNCGKKTINDLQVYLRKYNLELGLKYDDVIKRIAKLNDEDITAESNKVITSVSIEKELNALIAQSSEPAKTEKVQAKIPQAPKLSETDKNLTIDDICAKIGSTKKSRKRYGNAVKQILRDNKIDSLEKLLSLRPSDFMAFEGVGKTTLYHTRKAIESFGFVWSDVK